MALTLTAFMDRLRQRRAAPEFIPLITITFRQSFGGATQRILRISDRARYLPRTGGIIEEYLGLLVGASEVGHVVDLLDPSRSPAVADLVLNNARPVHEFPRLTDMVRHAANVEAGTVTVFDADVVIAYLFDGGTLGIDDVTIFAGPADRLIGAGGAGTEVTLRVGSDEGTSEVVIVDRAVACAGGVPGAYIVGFDSSTPTVPVVTAFAIISTTDESTIANGTGIINGRLQYRDAYAAAHREASGLTEVRLAFYRNLTDHPAINRFHFFPSTVGICQVNRAMNLSCDSTGGVDTSLAETLDILELAPPATLAELQAYTHNNPPTVIRTVASIDFAASGVPGDCTQPLAGASTYEQDLGAIPFWGIRVRNWNIPDTPGHVIDHDIRINMALD